MEKKITFESFCENDDERNILARDDDGSFKWFLVCRAKGDIHKALPECARCHHPYHGNQCNTSRFSPNTGLSLQCECSWYEETKA